MHLRVLLGNELHDAGGVTLHGSGARVSLATASGEGDAYQPLPGRPWLRIQVSRPLRRHAGPTNPKASRALRGCLGFVLPVLLLGGCSDVPALAPRHITSDALAFILELSEDLWPARVADGVFSGGMRSWEFDGHPVSQSALREIDVSTIRWVVLDTLRGAVRFYSNLEPTVSGDLLAIEVFPTTDAAGRGGGERRYRTLFWLADVVLSGDDMSALGSRRSHLERSLVDVAIFRPPAVSRVLGSEIDITVVVASGTRDIYPLVRH